MVRTTTASDSTMHSLVELIESGMPEVRHELPELLCEYVLLRDRWCCPIPSHRQDLLTLLHSGHQGVTSMNSRAEASGLV